MNLPDYFGHERLFLIRSERARDVCVLFKMGELKWESGNCVFKSSPGAGRHTSINARGKSLSCLLKMRVLCFLSEFGAPEITHYSRPRV